MHSRYTAVNKVMRQEHKNHQTNDQIIRSNSQAHGKIAMLKKKEKFFNSGVLVT